MQISLLNDFVFCPKSIYLHNLYGKYTQGLYHQEPQQRGRLAHENIDNQEYSSKRSILQGLEIYSASLKLCGKLDLFDESTGVLVERKFKIKQIYDGYIYQLYAQFFCLTEMGYKVKKMFLHSLSDNKRYKIEIPSRKEKIDFSIFVKSISEFVISPGFVQNQEKCKNCIYSNLCDSFNP